MSARAKSPARGQSSNVDRTSKNFSALKKIKKVLTVLLPLLVLHGENFPTAFAEWISSVKEHIRDLSMAERTELFKSDRDLTDDVGRLCLDAIDTVSDDWTVVKNLNGDHHKSIKIFLTAWLLTPCIKEFAGILDEKHVDIFTAFVIKCEDWKNAAEILLGQELNVKPLAMVVLLYDGVENVVKAPETMLSKALREGANRLERYCTETMAGGASQVSAIGPHTSGPPAAIQAATGMAWCWGYIYWCLNMCWFIFCALIVFFLWSNSLLLKCNHTYEQGFTTIALTKCDAAHLCIMPYAFFTIVWRRVANSRKPVKDSVDYACMSLLLFAGASLTLATLIPIYRCGPSAEKILDTKPFIPFWAGCIVAMYTGECMWVGLNALHASQRVEARDSGWYMPSFAILCALYTFVNELSRIVGHPWYVRNFVVIMLLCHFCASFDKNTKRRATGYSGVAGRCMVCLLLMVEFGLVGPLQSSQPDHLRHCLATIGGFHKDLMIIFIVYAILDWVLRKHL